MVLINGQATCLSCGATPPPDTDPPEHEEHHHHHAGHAHEEAKAEPDDLIKLRVCQEINEFHRSVGGIVAHDTIPDEGEMLRLLRKAKLVEAQVRDEPDRYLALARRNERR